LTTAAGKIYEKVKEKQPAKKSKRSDSSTIVAVTAQPKIQSTQRNLIIQQKVHLHLIQIKSIHLIILKIGLMVMPNLMFNLMLSLMLMLHIMDMYNMLQYNKFQ
jgi:hypothetical protein